MMLCCKNCGAAFKRRNKNQIFCSLSCSSRYRKQNLKIVTLPVYSEKLAELVGMLLGDGFVNKYQVGVTLNSVADKEYIQVTKLLFSDLFDCLEVYVKPRRGQGCTDVGVCSRTVVLFFTQMGIVSGKPYVPSWIFSQPSYVYACVRGLIDTEGCVQFKKYEGKIKKSVYRQLVFTNKNPVLLKFVYDSLLKLGLKPTNTAKKNIYLSNDSAIDTYRSFVGLHNPKLEAKSRVKDYNTYISWRDAGNGYPDSPENCCP